MSEARKFLCGVVEGFYGRPWTFEQRMDLFQKMRRWEMNVFLYAPKDDSKHRVDWRDLYTLEECHELSRLIKACSDSGLKFTYAIAPGLDIVFSGEREVVTLKKKLEQVVSLGCSSFAILFDDIDPILCTADAKVFATFGHAQVAIANELFNHLKKPEIFMFCPTEYCSSRAEPAVKDSQYLNTIGSDLDPGIDILWTGPKVISKTISLQNILDITAVLRRKPIIWDNLHANDYDQRRLFLGPYSGRSVSLIPKLRGVLTNPNCEYSANFIPIHTLAQWSKCFPRRNSEKVEEQEESEHEDDDEYMHDSQKTDLGNVDQGVDCEYIYEPRRALRTAIVDWLAEFTKHSKREKSKVGKSEAAKSLNSTDDTTSGSNSDPLPLMGVPVEGGSAKENSMETADSDQHSDSGMSSPMEVNEVQGTDGMDSVSHTDQKKSTSPLPELPQEEDAAKKKETQQFTLDDLNILVDFFYLPHKYGPHGVKMLKAFSSIKSSSPSQEVLQKYHAMFEKIKGDLNKLDIVQEEMEHKVYMWYRESLLFKRSCKEICQMFSRLTSIPNRPLLYDIYPYVWDAKEAVMLLDCYVSWLIAGGGEDKDDSWLPPDVEPFVLRGGITAAMHRLLPQLSGSDEFFHRKAPHPSPQIFTIRPYRPEDKELVYKTCLLTGDGGADGTHLFTNYPNLLGDRFVGPYTKLCPSLSFVLEDDEGVCGYVLAALDSKAFYEQFEKQWAPEVAKQYPIPQFGIKEFTPEEELAYILHNPKFLLSGSVYEKYPSHLHIDLMPRAQGKGVGSRMLRTILSALKAKVTLQMHPAVVLLFLDYIGPECSKGVHLEMNASNTRALKFYLKFGFSVLDLNEEQNVGQASDDTLILGRKL